MWGATVWSGECGRCGHCCTRGMVLPSGEILMAACQHLVADKRLGEAEATRCAVYDSRYVGMPITLEAPRGDGTSDFFQSTCDADFPAVSQGVPSDCSYKWEGNASPPNYNPFVFIADIPHLGGTDAQEVTQHL